MMCRPSGLAYCLARPVALSLRSIEGLVDFELKEALAADGASWSVRYWFFDCAGRRFWGYGSDDRSKTHPRKYDPIVTNWALVFSRR